MDIKERAYEWLQKNALLYRGDNASDCMIRAFVAGAAAALEDGFNLEEDELLADNIDGEI